MTELKCLDKVKILVLNKIDKAIEEKGQDIVDERINEIKEKYPNYHIIVTSAVTQENLGELIDLIQEYLPMTSYNCKVLIPYSNTDLVAMLHRNAIVKSEEYADNGILIEVILNEKEYNLLGKYILS